MITNNRTFPLGIALLIIPLLGFPLWWKFALVIVCGLILIALSLDMSAFDLSQFHLPDLHKEPHVPNESSRVESMKIETSKVEAPKPVRRPRKKKEVQESVVVPEKVFAEDPSLSSIE